MSDQRKELDEKSLEQVVGGFFYFDPAAGIMTYTHQDGTTTKHVIKNMAKAWEMSNNLHGQGMPEDDILDALVEAKYLGA